MVPGLDLLCFWNLDAIVFTQRDDHMIPQLLTLSNRVFFSSEFFFFLEHRGDEIHTVDQLRWCSIPSPNMVSLTITHDQQKFL